jgi:hypothetical protein
MQVALHMPDTHEIPGVGGEQTEADEVDTVIGPGLPPPLIDDGRDDGWDGWSEDAGNTSGSMPALEEAGSNVHDAHVRSLMHEPAVINVVEGTVYVMDVEMPYAYVGCTWCWLMPTPMTMFLVVAYVYTFEVALSMFCLPWLVPSLSSVPLERRGNEMVITQDFNRPLVPLLSGMSHEEAMHMEYVIERCIQDLKRSVAIQHACVMPP